MKSKKGFTLIELLVVLVILGLLATLVTISVKNSRTKSRDGKRLSDLSAITKGLEAYYNDFGVYPEKLDWGGSLTERGATYIPKISLDPINKYEYKYQYAVLGDGSDYILAAKLENPKHPSLNEDIDGNKTDFTPPINCDDPVYCVSP